MQANPQASPVAAQGRRRVLYRDTQWGTLKTLVLWSVPRVHTPTDKAYEARTAHTMHTPLQQSLATRPLRKVGVVALPGSQLD